MLWFVLRRVGQGLVVLLGATIAVFLLMRLVPGDPALVILGRRASPEAVQALRDQLGLTGPVAQQYWTYLGGVVTLDFGQSIFKNEAVSTLVWPRLLTTMQLCAYATAISILVAVPLGVISAVRRNRAADHAIRTSSMTAFAMPPFWIGLLLILIFGVELGWLPTSGGGEGALGRLEALTLPAITLSLGIAPLLARTLRSSMIETLGSEFVEAATARGLARRRVLYKHALRASLISTLTVLGILVCALLSGTVIVETVFDLPGMGALMLEGVTNRDFPVVQSTALLFATTIVVINLVTDVAYALIDPRVRLS
jgi:peptide/nickel transport system permease protein